MLEKEHDNYVFSLVKAVTHAHCNVRRRGTTWRNTIRITGKFIRKTMTKLKLFNYQSHPVLHAWITRTLRKHLCFLSCLGCVMFRLSHTAICSKLYFWCALANDTQVLFFPHLKHRTPKGWRVRREGHCWLVRTLLWCSPAWYWITLLNTSYCVAVTTVIYELWMNELTSWIFHVCCFVTRWTWDVCCWLYNIISMPGHDVYRQAKILLSL